MNNQTAIRKIISAISDLADVVRELDPGKTETYRRIEDALSDARESLLTVKPKHTKAL